MHRSLPTAILDPLENAGYHDLKEKSMIQDNCIVKLDSTNFIKEKELTNLEKQKLVVMTIMNNSTW